MSDSPPFVTRLLIVAVRFTRRDGQRPMGRVYLRRVGGRDRASFEVPNPEDWHVGYYVELSAQQLEPNLTAPAHLTVPAGLMRHSDVT